MRKSGCGFAKIARIMEFLEGRPAFEEGFRRALPAIAAGVDAVAGLGGVRNETEKQEKCWKTVAEWSDETRKLPDSSLLVLHELLSREAKSLQDGGGHVTTLCLKEVDFQVQPIALLTIPLVDSGNVLAYYGLAVQSEPGSDKQLMLFANVLESIMKVWIRCCRAEKRFRDIVDFIPNPLMMIDTREQVTVWNPAMEKMSGVGATTILGKGNYEHAMPFYNERRPTASNLILHPDAEWEASYQELRKEGDALFALARSEGLPGGVMLIASKTSLTRDLTGKVSGSVHVIQDVTHEHELESNLTRTEKMYRSISEFAGVGIALLGERIVYSSNENFNALLELENDGVTMQTILERIDPDDRQAIEGLLMNCLQEAPPASFEFITLLPKKGRREFRGYAQSVTYENMPAIHFVIIDVTEPNEMERRKKIHLMKMYHSDRLSALGTLSAGIAHELNQPLNTIRVITDGVLYGKDQGWSIDEEELYENAAMISKQIMRMSQVIKNIKTFARDEFERSSEDVDPNEAIQNVFSMIGQQMIAHNIRVEISLESNLPRLKSQLNHLEQVIMNLVVNARQALDGSTRKDKRIWIKTGHRFGQIFIEVGDNATGIAEAHQKEIFDPFFTTKVVGQGTGLGLSISQTIIASYDGDIQSYNNSDGGATFFITIPVGGGR